MKKLALSLIVIGFSSISNLSLAQTFNEGNLRYNSCPVMNFCVDCGNQKARLSANNESLQQYFEKNFDNIKLKKQKLIGTIMIQVLVDTTGKACLKSISNNIKNNDPKKIAKLEIDDFINKMPAWQPAIYNNKKSNSSVTIKMNFQENGSYKVDYQSMEGFKLN